MDTLRTRLAGIIQDTEPGLTERLEHDPSAHLDLVALMRRATAETDALLAEAIGSARHAGGTWEQIGAVMGISKQAAQQRYGRPVEQPAGRAQTMLYGLNAFNEMAVLNRAGRYGWHSVAYGPLYHAVARDTVQWEHARTLGKVPPYGVGWQPVGRGWAWWSYWARPTGDPVLPGDPSPVEFLRG